MGTETNSANQDPVPKSAWERFERWASEHPRLKWMPATVAVVTLVGAAILLFINILNRFSRDDNTNLNDTIPYSILATAVDTLGNQVPDAELTVFARSFAASTSVGSVHELTGGRPGDTVRISAVSRSLGLYGHRSVVLEREKRVEVQVQLRSFPGAMVTGITVDQHGNAISGCRVIVLEFGLIAVTQADGWFGIETPVPEGHEIRLRATAPGYTSAELIHPTGRTPARLVLTKTTGLAEQ